MRTSVAIDVGDKEERVDVVVKESELCSTVVKGFLEGWCDWFEWDDVGSVLGDEADSSSGMRLGGIMW
mgnify:CR=1 FL=1